MIPQQPIIDERDDRGPRRGDRNDRGPAIIEEVPDISALDVK